MELHNTKGGGIHSLATMLCVMLIALLNACCCGAAVLAKSNSSFHCDGRLEECLFELEELDLELVVNTYVSRMLQQTTGGGHVAQSAVYEANKQAIPCNKGKPYGPCLGDPSGNPAHCRNTFSCRSQAGK